MSEKLKPCPFCGGERARTIHIRDGRKVACICGACGKPEFHGPLDRPDAETRAITAWNTRTNSEPRPAGDLREALGTLSYAAYDYAGNYLLDERDDPELCWDSNHQQRIRALFEAIEAADGVLASLPAEARCGASPDHADIMETINNAADDWQKQGYTSALAEVRDMANVGRALMEALPAGYSYMNCPSEIVSDLQNEREEAIATHSPAPMAGAVRPFAEWHEDHGDVLWWKLPIQESPYVGSPLDLGRSMLVTVQIGFERHDLPVTDTGGWPFDKYDETSLYWSPLPDARQITAAAHPSTQER